MNITATSLKHPTTIGKIDQAMREALKASRASGRGIAMREVTAKSGRCMLAVVHSCDSVPAFSFWSPCAGDITPAVLKALRSSGAAQ